MTTIAARGIVLKMVRPSLIAGVELYLDSCAFAGFRVLSAVNSLGPPHVGVRWLDRPK